MYRAIHSFFLAILLVVFSAGGCLAQTKNSIRLTTGNWQPFTSKDVLHYGFAAHIVSEAFALVGVEVEYGFFPWKRAMKLARTGKWEGSIVWLDTEERRKGFYFSDPVASSTNAFFHLSSYDFDWAEFGDLADFRVGGTVEYSYGLAFDTAERAGLFETNRTVSDEVGLTNLLKGRIDVFPGELQVTYAQIRDSFPERERALFTHHPLTFSEEPLHVLFSKEVAGMDRMRDRFNEGLGLLKASGRYDEIMSDAAAGKYD